MKKLLFFVFVIMFSLLCALHVGADEIVPISDQPISSALSPALSIIAADSGMAKAGLVGRTLVFSSDDFCRALNLSRLDSITVTSLPDKSAGRLLLGTTLVSSGQKISSANLDLLAFSPASGEKCSAKFDFTVADLGYTLTCSVYMLDKIDQSPVSAHSSDVSLNVRTYSDISAFGKLSAYDPEGSELRFEIIRYPSHGLLIMNDTANGDYVYLPSKNYSGTDSFRYVVRDKYGNYSEASTVNISVSRLSLKYVYSDMLNHPANNSALTLTELGIMNGVRDGDSYRFSPLGSVSREEFTVMALKIAGITDLPSLASTEFADDSEISISAKPYISAAKQLGYLDGLTDGSSFYPDRSITRSEAALIIDRIVGASGIVGSFSYSPSFNDSSDIPSGAERSIECLHLLGMLDDADGKICASDDLTRADAAVMIAAVLKLKK